MNIDGPYPADLFGIAEFGLRLFFCAFSFLTCADSAERCMVPSSAV